MANDDEVTLDADEATLPKDVNPLADPRIPTEGVVRALAATSDFVEAPPSIPGFEIIKKIGEGGMGVVWAATQLSTKRLVALKTTSAASFGSERARQRFEREVELAARMNHPNVAQIYDSGFHQGVCYYAMELIDGEDLESYVKKQKRSRRQILELMTVVCRAVQYAHQNGIIHRDLKPSNIFVSQDGQPHVLDFGLAKALEADVDLTLDGSRCGTPRYMSPEQAAGRLDLVDTRSDVYTFGVIFFYLLSGQFPHETSGSSVEVMNRIAELEPKRLSAVEPNADRDLDVLLAKALSKERDGRYKSAGEFADDLNSYLDGDPIRARAPTLAYLLRKTLKKRRVSLGIVTAIGALLLGMAVWSYVRVTREKNNAIAANSEKERERREALRLKGVADANAALARENQIRALASERNAESRLAETLVSQGNSFAASGRWEEAKLTYWEAYETFNQLQVSPLHATAALCIAHTVSPPAPLSLNIDESSDITSVAILPDGRTALSASRPRERTSTSGNRLDCTLRIWDLSIGREIRRISLKTGELGNIAVSPDGRVVLSSDRTLWDLTTGKAIRRLGEHVWYAEISCLAVSPDGHTAVSGYRDDFSNDQQLVVWNLDTGKETRRLFGVGYGGARCVAIASDGHAALSSAFDGTLKLWDLATGAEIRILRGAGARDQSGFRRDAVSADGRRALPQYDRGFFDLIAISPNGLAALTTGYDRSITLWNLTIGKQVRALPGHDQRVRKVGDGRYARVEGLGVVNGIAISPDGRTALSCGDDGKVKLSDLSTGGELLTLTGHSGKVNCVAFSPDGRMALSGGDDGTLKLWNLTTGQETRTLPWHVPSVSSVAISSTGHLGLSVDSQSYSADTMLWDLATSKEIQFFHGTHIPDFNCVAFGPNARFALVGSRNSIDEWDFASEKTAPSFHHDSALPGAVCISPDGRIVLSGSSSYVKQLLLWDLASGKPTTLSNDGLFTTIAISGDGRSAISGGPDGRLRVWDLVHRKERLNGVDAPPPVDSVERNAGISPRQASNILDYPNGVETVAISYDGHTALSGGGCEKVIQWDLTTGKVIRALSGHTAEVTSVALSSDGRTGVSGSLDGSLRLWDLSTGKEILAISGRTGPVNSVALSHDGMILLSGGEKLQVFDFSRAPQYVDFSSKVPAAQSRLKLRPDDSEGLAVLGRWWAFRGIDDWAVELLERARSGGASIEPLLLARCYWKLSENMPIRSILSRDDYVNRARRELAGALERSKDEDERFYFHLIDDALKTPASSSAPVLAEGKIEVPLMPESTLRMTKCSLAEFVNYRIEHLLRPPVGEVMLGGIPFSIPSIGNNAFHSADRLRPDDPTSLALPVNVAGPRCVHVLLNGDWTAEPRDGNEVVGSIELSFAEGERLTAPIFVGETLREAWLYDDNDTLNHMSPPQPAGVHWDNVWKEHQSRGHPATAFIDMVSIDVPEDLRRSDLARITIKDESVETIRSLDPGLIVMGVTIESDVALPSREGTATSGPAEAHPKKRDRIIFAIDARGAMLLKLDDVRDQIAKALKELQSNQSFDIVVSSNTEVTSFQRELVPASAENIKRAEDFLSDIQAGGTSGMGGLVSKSIRLRPDVIWVIGLGDIDPSTIMTIREANATARIPINTVTRYAVEIDGGDDAKAMSLLWQIAHDSGGVFLGDDGTPVAGPSASRKPSQEDRQGPSIFRN